MHLHKLYSCLTICKGTGSYSHAEFLGNLYSKQLNILWETGWQFASRSKQKGRRDPAHSYMHVICQCPSFATEPLAAGAEVINEAAVAAEKVALEANQLAADIASKSQDEEAVTEAHKQRYATPISLNVYVQALRDISWC